MASNSNELKKSSYIVFVGDAIVDFFSYIDRMPKMGETFNSNSFKYGPGGKAVNACVAASKLQSPCAVVCKLGEDIFGKYYLDEMKKNNIKTDNVYFSSESNSGCACVMVDKSGYNSIVVNSGTNYLMNVDDIKASEELIKGASILVTNTLITLDAALYSMKLAKQYNVLTIFNFAASSNEIDPEYNKYIDILIANEVEAEAFTGGTAVNTADDARAVVNSLFDRDGLNIAIIITLGEKGVVWGDKRTRKISYVPCKKVKVVDTTGAGDAFIGTLAHCLFKLGLDAMERSIELACEYATLSVQAPGTQVSYPLLADLDEKFKF